MKKDDRFFSFLSSYAFSIQFFSSTNWDLYFTYKIVRKTIRISRIKIAPTTHTAITF